MKYWLVFVLLSVLVLGMGGLVGAQGPGIISRTDCATITLPVVGQTFCFDQTANVLKGWSGTAWIAITTSPTFTLGSIPFVSATGLTQNNTNLFWDNTNNRLGIGTAAPTATVSIQGVAPTATVKAPVSVFNTPLSTVVGGVSGIKVEVAPSAVSNPAATDWVAFFSRIESTSRNRIWAINTVTDISSGQDATAWGYELDVNNNVAAAPDPRNTFHKLGIDVVSGGTFAPSAAFNTLSTTLANRWKHGLWFDSIGGQTGSTLIKVNNNVNVDYGLDLRAATINITGLRVGSNTTVGVVAGAHLGQLANAGIALLLQRFTDTAPTGNLLQVVNAANSVVLMAVDVSGNITTPSVSGGAAALLLTGSDVQWGKPLVALGGGLTPTLGTIGGAGPTVAAQNTWMRVLDSGGAVFWVPVWK